jgi:Eco57I restriction-modification methylase
MSHRQPFLNIRTEGALLPSDLLSRLMEGTYLPGLKPEDYHLGAGEKLNEAISRSWTRLLSLWLGFRKAKAALPATDLGTTLTRERWLLQLFQELGYGRLIGATPFEIDEKTYPISHVWKGQYYEVPIHLVSFRADLDKRSEQRIQGASKASPHGMVQEFLNRSEHDLWAFVSNGLKLLILRDNASLTRQAYVEFDLEGIFEAEAYADFRLLWLVCHQSRLEGTAKDRPETCWLEVWSKQAQTDGRRALDQLRVGVEKALENLGTGFIAHKANQNLRDRLKAGELNKQDFYRQLLRLVYRLIFLFVAEDRDLLHFPGASDEARSRYARFYSGQRLRRMAERTRGGRHADLWVGLRLVFAKLGNDRGCPELGLPALGGFLFGPQAMPDLESAELANEHLLMAIRNLGLVKDRSGWRLVDYRNLGSEELGSVYESLLELNPTMELEAGKFSLSTVAGNQRKTSGSYYTPDSLVQCLLDSALDPVVEQAIKGKTPAEAEKAILALKVCDPAVGSGHFLVGAAHRLASHLAQVRAQAQGESEPSPLYYQHALRDVIGHCLYGVDINPMAAELCRVSLWLEAIEPGKPLSFLDHHIRVGNSLLGATPALLSKGIPDEAFTPIEGDDKEICSRFKKVNKQEREGQRRLFAATTEPWERLGDLAVSMTHLDDAPDDSIEAVRNKERMYEAMVRSGNYLDGQFWADTWCAAFVWKKTKEFKYPITEEVFRRIEHNPHACDSWMRNEIERLSQQYQFFHWHLAFPDVFSVPASGQASENEQAGWNGGFDVVLGNPPWERVKLQEKEWFAERNPEIANVRNAAARKRLIEALRAENAGLHEQFLDDLRKAECESHFLRNSGRYPLCGRGDINVYTVFAEGMRNLLSERGLVGCVLPSGIATDDTTKFFFQEILVSKSLVSLYSFENEDLVFPAVHHSTKFCLFCTGGGTKPKARAVDFVFFARQVEDLRDNERRFTLTSEDFELLNPNTRTCPIFRSWHDAEILKAIYRRTPIFVRELDSEGNPWNLEVRTRLWHTTEDAEYFLDRDGLLADGWQLSGNLFLKDEARCRPLYEGKMVHQFDHRFGSYSGQSVAQANQGKLPELDSEQHADPNLVSQPRYWIPESAVEERLQGTWERPWLLGWRDITSAVVHRTAIASVVPRVACADSLPLMFPYQESASVIALLLANLNSFALDYAARQKAGGTHLRFFILKQLPVFSPATYTLPAPWSVGMDVATWLLPRVLELVYTAWDLEPLARDFGLSTPPFRWDEERRFLLRCELDAAFFHLYLPAEASDDWRPAENETADERARLKASFPTPRDVVSYIMDTFPIVKRKDEAKWNGDYRTKRVILEIYDAMAEAARTGIPYQTRLSPPPADAAVAHPLPEELIRVAAVSKDAFSDIAALPDEAWATPVGLTPENIALFSLIDVLRNIGEAVGPERVRLAAILVRKPVLAAAFMEDTQAKHWLRLIGSDARPVKGNVVQISQFQKNGVDYPWAAAIGQLRGSGALVVDSAGKWSAGSRMPTSSGQDWISGRAAIAVQLLSAIDPARVEQKLIAFNRSVEDGTARRAVS